MSQEKPNLDDVLDDVEREKISTIGPIKAVISDEIRDEYVHASKLAGIFERDQASAAKILKLANSILYNAGGNRFSDLTKAIIHLGNNTSKEVLLSAAVCELFKSDDLIEDYSRTELWKNSIAVAIGNKIIYQSLYDDYGSEEYVAGLLRNIGIVMEDQFAHEYFHKAVSQRRANKSDLTKEEKLYLGFTHEEIGEKALRRWNFPDRLCTVVGSHHTIKAPNQSHEKLIYATRLSELFCHESNIGYSDRSNDYEKDAREIKSKLGIDDSSYESLKGQHKEGVDKLVKETGWFFENGR